MILQLGGTVCRIAEIKDFKLHLEHLETREERVMPIGDLAAKKPGIDYRVIQNVDDDLEGVLIRSDAERRVLRSLPTRGKTRATLNAYLEAKRWLDALHDRGYRDFREADLDPIELRFIAQRSKLPLRSPETLMKWEKRSIEDGALLLPDFASRGGKNQSRGDPRVEGYLARAFKDIREGKGKPNVKDVKTLFRDHVKADPPADLAVKPIVLPSDSTLYRRLNSQLSQFERAVAKYGLKRAERMFRGTAARAKVSEPGLVYEFDDTDTRVFCIDNETGLPWGRGWATLGVDQASGFPVGMNMDTIPMSAQSAVATCVHAIEVKDLSELNAASVNKIKYKWEAQGLPVGTVFDNALYNQPRILSLGADVADISWARPKTPTDKREIEYLNGRLKTYVGTLPGFRGALNDADALKEGLGTSVLDIKQLRIQTLIWLIGDEANRPGEKGTTSRQRYLEDGHALKLNARYPMDVRRLRMLRMLGFNEPFTWNRYGIRVLGLTYQDIAAFANFVRTPGGKKKVHIMVDPQDLSWIHVVIPDTDIEIPIPCCSPPDYVKGLTLYGQKLILKLCREKKKQNPNIEEMYKARSDLKLMVAQWTKDGSVKLRKRAVRVKGSFPAKERIEEYAAHDAELGCEELGKVTMEEGDVGWAIPDL